MVASDYVNNLRRTVADSSWAKITKSGDDLFPRVINTGGIMEKREWVEVPLEQIIDAEIDVPVMAFSADRKKVTITHYLIVNAAGDARLVKTEPKKLSPSEYAFAVNVTIPVRPVIWGQIDMEVPEFPEAKLYARAKEILSGELEELEQAIRESDEA